MKLHNPNRKIKANDANTVLELDQLGAGNVLDLKDNGTSVLTVNDGGKVGVATDSPSYRIDSRGGTSTDLISSTGGFNINIVQPPNATTSGTTLTLVDGLELDNTATYWYRFTFYTALGETDHRDLAKSITTNATQRRVQIDNIPVSTDERVIGRRIYRGGGGQQYNALLLVDIPDNTTTTYLDLKADEELGTVNNYYMYNKTSKYITVGGADSMVVAVNQTSLGVEAGAKITTGGRNVFFGRSAGYNALTSTDSVFVGHGAGSSLTAGGTNVIIGASAASRLDTGGSNTVIGGYSGYNLDLDSSNNVMIGFGPTYQGTNSKMSNNTMVGTRSGYYANAVSNAMYLGYMAGAYETGSGKLIIDSRDRTNESLSRSSALIYGEMNATPANQILSLGGGGKVGIGTTSPDEKLQVVGTSMFGEDTTNFSKFESDGTLHFNGTATVWKDINVGGISLKQGATAPDPINLDTTSIQVYAFDGATLTEEASGAFELQHDYKEGTNIVPHIHWYTTDTGAGNVKWQLEYYIKSGTSEYTGTTSVTTAATGTAWEEIRSDFPAITGTNFTIGMQIHFRLFRDPTDAADTYASDAALGTFGIHHEVDTVGSRQISTK